MWKLKHSLTNESIWKLRNFKKYLETNKNGNNILTPMGCSKKVLRRKFIAIKAYIRKKKALKQTAQLYTSRNQKKTQAKGWWKEDNKDPSGNK